MTFRGHRQRFNVNLRGVQAGREQISWLQSLGLDKELAPYQSVGSGLPAALRNLADAEQAKVTYSTDGAKDAGSDESRPAARHTDRSRV
jgi:hypothetical protein